MESHGNKAVVAIVTLVLGLAVGGGVGYATGNMNKEDTKSNTSSSMSMDAESDGVTVGGAKMVKTMDIVDNAANAKNVSTLVDLVGKAELVETLKMDGPYTVFGPNNDAFAKLPAATVADLQKPENIKALQNILTYHVVPGTYTSADLKVMAQKGEALTTVQGQTLMPVLEDNAVKLMDASGNTIDIETTDVISSNGVTHVVKSVMMPKS